MKIIEVYNKQTQKAFLELPRFIYKNDSNWIAPLETDIKNIFSNKTNKLLNQGAEVKRWLIYENNVVVGRIAAFVNPNYKEQQPTGGIGFFECVNNQKAAHLLFDTAKAWLENKGMQAMDGPINLGERDQWWGLLVEGFQSPLYQMNYNLPYYQQLFESYGFKNYFNQECYQLTIGSKLSDRLQKFHQRIKASNQYQAEYFQKKNLKKYVQDFVTIYNDAWSVHGGGKQLTFEQALKIFKQMRPVIVEKLIWFVYHNNRPIAFWVNLPELNVYFSKLNGKFGWFEKLKFLFLKTFTENKKVVGLVFGVVQEFQGRGVEAFMIEEGRAVFFNELKIEQYEMQWIGDFNPKMIKIAHELGATLSRKFTTYRYLFDSSMEFQRHRIL